MDNLILAHPVGHLAPAGDAGTETLVHRGPGNGLAAGEILPATAQRPQHAGLTVWFTGLSGAGKSSISRSVYEGLLARNIRAELLDSDELRKHCNHDLGFSAEDRDENIRRIGEAAGLLTNSGVVALVAAISPYRAARDRVRGRIANFMEVYVDAPLSVCEQRDSKGLYRKARSGEISRFTGIDDPYEPPLSPELHCHTERDSLTYNTEKVLAAAIRFLLSIRA